VRKTRSKFFFVGPSPKTRLRVVSLSGSEEEILASEGRKAGRRVGIAVATRPETVKSHRNNPAVSGTRRQTKDLGLFLMGSSTLRFMDSPIQQP
jgi:hypothetical protein